MNYINNLPSTLINLVLNLTNVRCLHNSSHPIMAFTSVTCDILILYTTPCTQTYKHTFVRNPIIIISDLPFHIIISRIQPSLLINSPDTMFRFMLEPLT